MTMVIVKYAVTALIVVVISELAKSFEKLGAFLGALPIVSIMVMTWLFIETKDSEKIAEYSTLTFWYVAPALPSFLIIPILLKKGFNFWASMGIAALTTFAFFGITILIAKQFGVKLI